MKNEDISGKEELMEPLNPLAEQRMSFKGHWLDYEAQPTI